jgi:hypothetical protein
MRRCLLLLAAAATASTALPTKLEMTNASISDWAFSGGAWKLQPSGTKASRTVNGSRAWIVAPSSNPEAGNLAIYTKRAFAACNISLTFMHASAWTTAALVVGARNSSGGYFIVDDQGATHRGSGAARLNPLGIFLNPLGLFLRTSIPFI